MSGDGTAFTSKDFALRAQKKIFSQFSNRKTVKMFINERVSSILDLLYQLIKVHVGSISCSFIITYKSITTTQFMLIDYALYKIIRKGIAFTSIFLI